MRTLGRPVRHILLVAVRPLVAIAVLALVLGGAAPAAASIYTVGAGAGCTHADLLSALIEAVNHAGSDEIRLLINSNHQGPFFINTDGLVVRGGYASCAAAAPTGYSTLLGTNTSRALFLNAVGTVVLERLNLTGGHVTGNGGGLFVQGSPNRVTLANVAVFGNSATGLGGNIYVASAAGAEVVLSEGALLASGSALDGGGIACSGGGTVNLESGSLIANNVATGDGGGVHLGAGCWFRHLASGSVSGIASNQAGGDGGGAYVEGGSDFSTLFNSDGLDEISNNTAGGKGGGVYIVGSGSVLQAYFSRISANQAGVRGGGIAAENGAMVVLGRPTTDPDSCKNPARCSLVSSNSAPLAAGIWTMLATLTAHGTHFEGNSAPNGGAIGYFTGGSTVVISSSVMAGNDGLWPLYASGTSTLTLGNVTAVNNTNAAAGFVGFSLDAGEIRVLSSLFDQPDSQIFSGQSSQLVQLDCVLSRTVNFLSGLPTGTVTRSIVIADPRLRNPAAGDYRLSETSPAIDRCDTSQWQGAPTDLEWQARDIDHALPNSLGIRDLGADEVSILRRDGFESGGTGAWWIPGPP